MQKLSCFLIGMIVVGFTNAASVSNQSKISKIYTYGSDTNFHNQIVVEVDHTITGCEGGYWLHANDKLENRDMSAFLLSAFHAGSNVYIAAYDDQLWSGSASKYCKIHSLGLIK